MRCTAAEIDSLGIIGDAELCEDDGRDDERDNDLDDRLAITGFFNRPLKRTSDP